MKNKGLIYFLTIVISFLSIYYLQFTFVSQRIQGEATEISRDSNGNIDFKKNSQYICAETLSSFDSLALNKDSGIPCLAHECLLYNHTNELILVDKNITFNM